MAPFHKEAKAQLDKAQTLFDEVESLYLGLETFFCFNHMQYQLHSFMKDIKTFVEQFKVNNICNQSN